MFEYLNFDLIKATIFLFIPISLLIFSRKANISQNLKILLVFLMSIVLAEAYYSYSSALENIQSAKDGSHLKCSIGDNNYKVSMKDGWKVDENYFLKDSLLIRADKCETHD